MDEKFYTCDEVAKITGKSKRTVWKWCNTGKLKARRPTGRDYIITEKDFRSFWFGSQA